MTPEQSMRLRLAELASDLVRDSGDAATQALVVAQKLEDWVRYGRSIAEKAPD